MIAVPCPWCEHDMELLSQAFSADSIVCDGCSTEVDLAPGPRGDTLDGAAPVRMRAAELALAA